VGDSGRTEWSDDRIAENIAPLRALPAEVARQAVKVDTLSEKTAELQQELSQIERDVHDGDRRLHERADREQEAAGRAREAIYQALSDVRAELLLQLADRDREYRRNIILAIGPLLLVVLAIAAKVLFGIDLPKP
jgi:chromosome segregation ATPase